MTVTVIERVLRELLDNAKAGRIDDAIRLICQETGLGLKEAKDLVEEMGTTFESFSPEYRRAGYYDEPTEHVVSYTNGYGEPVTQIFETESAAMEEARARAGENSSKNIRVARVTHRGVTKTTIERA